MKQFLQLQPRKWKEIYSIYFNSLDMEPSERTRVIEQHLISNGFTEENAVAFAADLVKSFGSIQDSFEDANSSTTTQEAYLTLQDIRLLKEKTLHEPSIEVKKLLVAYMVYARANPHHSNWIKSDKKVIIFLASLEKLKVSEQIYLTNQLHNIYNLNMQVVGSTQPIPCFQISWQADQDPIDEVKNPLVLLGPLNPATIKSFAEQIPYESPLQGEQNK